MPNYFQQRYIQIYQRIAQTAPQKTQEGKYSRYILVDLQKRIKLQQNRTWFQCTFDYKPSNQW